MNVADLPRDYRGRVQIFSIEQQKVIDRQPIDALDGMSRGLYRIPTEEELATAPPQIQPEVTQQIATRDLDKPRVVSRLATDIPERAKKV